ncbi:MAG: zinc-dependent metalloprotease family protein, partial [Flavobacteriales bacterium]
GATGTNKGPAISAMATTLNRVNGIYERDAALTMLLVANNDQLVFTNPATDGYTNNDGGTMLGENQTKCDAVIGSSNYDIGHVFSTGGGGVAYLNSPCTGFKAGGVTGRSAPVGDPFDIDYVAHEMGHQYGGNHTQNNNCNRAGQAAVEVGSGITIMGYAGVCAPNVASNSISMFGGYSLQEMHANITEGNSSNCPQTVALFNAPPTANAGVARTIPRNTPFVLTAVASDPNASDVLSYSWEQMDFQPSTQPPLASSIKGPNFRPWLPSSAPQRWFPQLATVLSGNTPSPNWEVLADVSRTYKFRVTVRDNAVEGGCNAQDNVTITVDGNSGPFLVSQPNTPVTWTGGSIRTVTWDVAGTSSIPVSCTTVDVLLSIDGGNSWSYVLASATPNNGSASINLPVVATSSARVMVRANGNVFYDVSDQNFTVTAPQPVLVAGKVWLEGPFNGSLMSDHLRSLGLIPTTEPYTALNFDQVGAGGGETCSAAVLATTGANAIVDWVRLELRSAGSPATVVAARQALLQRDGDIVDVDGSSPVAFEVPAGNYQVAVRHRNHLGCMTASSIGLTGSATTVNFTSPSTTMYGTDARQIAGSQRLLWMGNTRVDGQLSYTGAGNDRDPIILRIGGDPTGGVQGYYTEDSSMDGIVRYTGTDNDRDPILLNIGGTMPTQTRQEQLP